MMGFTMESGGFAMDNCGFRHGARAGFAMKNWDSRIE